MMSCIGRLFLFGTSPCALIFWLSPLFMMLSPFTYSQEVWTLNLDSITTWSSVKSWDLNEDGVQDFVLGGGYELTPSDFGTVAINGATGNMLWAAPARDQIFSCAVFLDVNEDQVVDVIIGGRDAELQALSGDDGSLIWEFYPYSAVTPPADSGYYNFYTPQILDDVDQDGVPELLCTNGGDLLAQPGDPDRPPGHLMVISGSNGEIIAEAETPDGRETYCSPLVTNFEGEDTWIVFGTGGETVEGGLWRCPLVDLLNEDISGAELLHTSSSNGYVAPPSLADFNSDGVLDIVANSYDDDLVVIDGLTSGVIWELTIPNSESNVNPTIGNFNGDATPDVHTVFANGVWPNYNLFRKMTLDGTNGSFIDSVHTQMLKFSASMAVDFSGDGIDDLVEVNTGRHFNAQLQTWVFTVSVTVTDLFNETEIFNYGPHHGSSVVSSPWVGDADNDGLIDIVYAFMADSLNPTVTEGLRVRKLETQFQVPEQFSWASYLGTNSDGKYIPNSPVSMDFNQEEIVPLSITNCEDCKHLIYQLGGQLLDEYQGDMHQLNKRIKDNYPSGVYLIQSTGTLGSMVHRLVIP